MKVPKRKLRKTSQIESGRNFSNLLDSVVVILRRAVVTSPPASSDGPPTASARAFAAAAHAHELRRAAPHRTVPKRTRGALAEARKAVGGPPARRGRAVAVRGPAHRADAAARFAAARHAPPRPLARATPRRAPGSRRSVGFDEPAPSAALPPLLRKLSSPIADGLP